MKLALPTSVQFIIESLSTHGFEAYAVGGCVRDAILGREPDDWDITTSARPEQIKEVFSRTVDTGIEHGTVTVLHGGAGYEVTTYRIDGEYEDGRHPKEVSFTGNLREDLRRRDFTINAMAYNEETGLVDAFEGIEDLKKKRIRCVGVATERFGEDALRILRGLRFAAQLGFEVEEETSHAMRELAPTLSKISAERIQVEFSKLLLSKHPEMFDAIVQYEISPVIFPEYDELSEAQRDIIVKQLALLKERRCGKQSVDFVSEKSSQLALRWACVLQFFTTEQAVAILRRLKYDNKTTDYVKGILRNKEIVLAKDRETIRRALSAMGEELFSMEMEFRMVHAKNAEEMATLQHMLVIRDAVLESGECYSLKMLAVTGSDLIAAGCKQGKQVGETLKKLLDIVLTHPEKNEKAQLLALAEVSPEKK